jgi:hypothetical protein
VTAEFSRSGRTVRERVLGPLVSGLTVATNGELVGSFDNVGGVPLDLFDVLRVYVRRLTPFTSSGSGRLSFSFRVEMFGEPGVADEDKTLNYVARTLLLSDLVVTPAWTDLAVRRDANNNVAFLELQSQWLASLVVDPGGVRMPAFMPPKLYVWEHRTTAVFQTACEYEIWVTGALRQPPALSRSFTGP